MTRSSSLTLRNCLLLMASNRPLPEANPRLGAAATCAAEGIGGGAGAFEAARVGADWFEEIGVAGFEDAPGKAAPLGRGGGIGMPMPGGGGGGGINAAEGREIGDAAIQYEFD